VVVIEPAQPAMGMVSLVMVKRIKGILSNIQARDVIAIVFILASFYHIHFGHDENINLLLGVVVGYYFGVQTPKNSQ